jgi:hypothetical protein
MNLKLTIGSTCLVWSFLSLLCISDIQAQGLRGKITDPDGESLPFANIIEAGTNRGIASNIEGEYILALTPGRHRIKFQYLGYRPLDTIIVIGQGFTVFNAIMHPEIVALSEAVVSGKGEDPAYTIMRRAIAKAKYHGLQVDEYNAMVYVKGSGRLNKVPGLIRKRLEKEGVDTSAAYTQESVSKLHYIRPDQYRDTVVSIRTVGDDNNTSPMGFIYSSFYEPKVVNGISPLAPDAFSHYRFEYLGFIEDGDHVINKIKVTPKGRGDQVFEGVIYIVDNLWSIHSLDLTTYIWGIRFEMQQQFSPILPDVWLPVHEIYDVNGSIFGFGFQYRYFAQLSNYRIKLNPDLEVPVIVLDAKVEAEDAREAEEKHGNKKFDEGLTALDPGEELSVKQLRKMMREYEKQEIEALPESDTVITSSASLQVIDSTAYKKDSSYWEEIRPLPLTELEIKGYARQDSIASIPPEPQDDDDLQDTLSVSMNGEGFAANVKRREKFSITHLITGGRYAMGDEIYFQLKGPLQSVNYNTVDGFHAGYAFEFGNSVDQTVNWEAGPSIRYNFARESINYDGRVRLFGKGWDLEFMGGKQPRQFNYDFPLSPWLNTIYSLLANRNYLKEYEQTFVNVRYAQKILGGLGITLKGEYADREKLVNHSDIVFFDDKKLLFTSNNPEHVSVSNEAFGDHKAIISDASIWIKPFWEYKVNRGTKRKDYSRSPSFTLRYRKGWGSEEEYHPFDLVSGQLEYKLSVGAGSFLSMNVAAGKFIGENKPVYFQDFAHFPGNRLFATPINPVNSFRMLDYYRYSTNDEYASGLFNYQFRRFALTQFDFFRRQGIRENVLFNVLLTPESQQYAEIGYALNYVLRFLRVEFVTSWQDYTYQDFALRIGVATDFQSLFGF